MAKLQNQSVNPPFTMSTYVLVGNSAVLLKGIEKLYLNSERADVNFVVAINDDQSETIPAHKIILSASSPVFEAIFYGPIKETGDVKIVDASPSGFKEFLQFFYMDKVQLSSDNVITVAKLCHKYEMTDGLNLCQSVLQKIITNNEMQKYYALAIRLNLEDTIKFCEQQIKQNPEEMLKSMDFLKCDGKMFHKILELIPSTCDPLTIVESSMAWAKAECERNGLEDTPANLRAQLNDSFHRIPFADLNKEQFSQHVSGYKRFFTEDDLELIIEQTMSKKTKTVEPAKKMTFSLRDTRETLFLFPFVCSIVSNTKLSLKELHLTELSSPGPNFNVIATLTLLGKISERPLLLGSLNLLSTGQAKLIFPVAITINPHETYVLKVDTGNSKCFHVKLSKATSLKKDDVEIQFTPDAGIISGLVFERPSA